MDDQLRYDWGRKRGQAKRSMPNPPTYNAKKGKMFFSCVVVGMMEPRFEYHGLWYLISQQLAANSPRIIQLELWLKASPVTAAVDWSY